MGNESSVPADSTAAAAVALDAEELEEQARAAPSSSSLSPQHQSSPPQQQPPASPSSPPDHQLSSTTPNSNERRSAERSSRPGARMIGAVFGKSSRSAGQQSQQSPQNTSNSLMDFDDREKAPRPLNNNHDSHSPRTDSIGSTNSGYFDASMSSPQHPFTNHSASRGPQDVVTSHDYFAQAQQQNLQAGQQQQHLQQQQAQSPQTPQQNQMFGQVPQNALTHSQTAQTTTQQQPQSPPPPPPPPPHNHPQLLEKSSSSFLDVTQREHPAVGVMYEKPTPPAQKKSMFPGRATSRGAALISSMRNLNIAGALRGSGKKEVNDWEKQWDADEDDDSDEEEEEEGATDAKMGGEATSIQQSAASSSTSSAAPLHQSLNQARPNMDVGHSELPMQNPFAHPSVGPSGSMTSSATSNGSMMRFEGSASGFPPSSLDPSVAATPFGSGKTPFDSITMQQQQHDLATEWDMAGIQPPTAVVSDDDGMFPSSTSMTQAPQPPQPPPQPLAAKASVQMFLPMLRVLGKGSFGKVVLVQKRTGKERGGLFAMKILRKTHLVKRRQIERTRTERKVLSVVNHPFIMKLHYAFQTPDKLYLVLDYCPGGELFFHLSRFRRFPERVARFYAAELLLAIGHLHKRGIIYRDLKPENVLLDAEGHVKLGDFGLAKAGIKLPCEGATSMCGTPEYMAPEVLSQAGHGFCVDYWGLGMLLYEMMTGLPPWYTTDRAKLFRRLKSAPLDIPSYFSVQAANCVSALLERNPRRRLGVTGIRNSMEHEFFRNISWKSLYARRVEAPIRPCEGWRPPETVKGENEDDRILASTVGQPMSLTDIEGINRNDLDAATANFDNTFTRMPVESEEIVQDNSEGVMDENEAAEQLNEDTFLGFSFDSKDRDAASSASHNHHSSSTISNPAAPPSPRARSHATSTFPPASTQPHHTLD